MKSRTTFIMFCFILMLIPINISAETVEKWEDLNEQFLILYKEQKFIKAAGFGQSLVDEARALPSTEENQEKLAISLGNLSMIYTHLGKFAEAEELAWEELAIRQILFGKRSLDAIKGWNHLAIIYTMAQAPQDAEPCLLAIIDIEEEIYGKGSLETAASYKKLLKFYQITKNIKKEQETATSLAELEPKNE